MGSARPRFKPKSTISSERVHARYTMAGRGEEWATGRKRWFLRVTDSRRKERRVKTHHKPSTLKHANDGEESQCCATASDREVFGVEGHTDSLAE